jgi:Putative auto-transporter adhesin, head GIN domain
VIRRLWTAAIACTVMAVCCFALAAVLTPSNTTTLTREIPWDGSDRAILDVPGDLHFKQDAAVPGTLSITGPASVVERVGIDGGRIHDGSVRTHAQLLFVLTAPHIRQFQIKGQDRLLIEGFQNDTLGLTLLGQSRATAVGDASHIRLDLNGSSTADLGVLVSKTADVRVRGSATAIVHPIDAATLSVSGTATVTLRGRPRAVESDVSGAGRIITSDTIRSSRVSQ